MSTRTTRAIRYSCRPPCSYAGYIDKPTGSEPLTRGQRYCPKCGKLLIPQDVTVIKEGTKT